MHCCYRDTKMEIQGLSDGQNIHYQHGAPRRTGSSSSRTTTEALSRSVSNENETDEHFQSHELQNDNNNNRPRTSPFRLQAENGSGLYFPTHRQNGKNCPLLQTQTTNVGLRNANTLKEREFKVQLPTHDFFRTGYKYEVESGNNILQMALPFFEGEEEHSHQQFLQPSALRQQHEDDASQQHSLAKEQVAQESNNAAYKNTEEFYVVFNIVKEDSNNSDANKDRPGALSKEGDAIKGKEADNSNIESPSSLMEAVRTSVRKSVPQFNLVNSISVGEGEAAISHAKQSVHYEMDENIVQTNEYDDPNVRGSVCIENMDGEIASELASHPINNSALVSETADTGETVEMNDSTDTSGIISDLTESANVDVAATSASANETFSGTIMINNQSIIVTIENGILTLAAPPEGYSHRDDGMVSLKEHLGMKDHEDIVLLNYDSGTKSIGKISNVAITSSGHNEEPRAGLSMSDSELALADDCSLSELSASLDSCPVIKQEGAALCAIIEGDFLSQSTKEASTECNVDFHPLNSMGLSKKGALVALHCPQQGCPITFDTRQKLKVHLLNHTEDQRPFKCSFEDCGWAFTTSYKLKRHLQSHNKVRPHKCEFEGCGRHFTTVYNLRAHVKTHDQENAFVCEICNERFRSSTRLTNHLRVHFEPQRPYKCEFPGCEKTFITFSALFSHNRTHFRETGQFICTFPGCDKCYDKACRLKVHMRSHTGERPFVCDSDNCGWTFTSMSKLLRHKRKHDDDRRFTCPEDGCGKSFTRAEHLKGHSITHLGTKPFECHFEGCNAKFSARSSLYIHSKKHKQDAGSLRARCPVASCDKHFSTRSSLKSHMVKHHHLSPDVLNQLETTPTLTPSSELISTTTTTAAGPGIVGVDQLANLDLSSLFSGVPGGPGATAAGVGIGLTVGGTGGTGSFAMDLSLVSSGILTIDPSSVSSTLGTNATLTKAVDPLILTAGTDMGVQHGLEGAVGSVLPPQATLHLDDVQTVTTEALGTLTALTLQGPATVDHALSHTHLSGSSSTEPDGSPSPGGPPVAELLALPSKVLEAGLGSGRAGMGPLLGCVEVLGPQEGRAKVLTQYVFPGHSATFSPQKDPEFSAMSPSSFLESGGSARTDYRAIQIAKKRKQRGPAACSGSPGLGQRKGKGGKAGCASSSFAPCNARYSNGATVANGGLTLCDPVTGTQYVQIQLLQDDPASDGDLPFQLSSQASSSHSQLTVDLPVNILQEPPAMTEDDNGSDNSQFTGSTINLQDLE
ncbi:zinc finger protein ZXDC [Osmerus eperlanus]|uniref:zinc finger protein ZXDC n=1 Tax=Osmerus eperlanus TaxID=29151 RepID=UPI002E0EE409